MGAPKKANVSQLKFTVRSGRIHTTIHFVFAWNLIASLVRSRKYIHAQLHTSDVIYLVYWNDTQLSRRAGERGIERRNTARIKSKINNNSQPYKKKKKFIRFCTKAKSKTIQYFSIYIISFWFIVGAQHTKTRKIVFFFLFAFGSLICEHFIGVNFFLSSNPKICRNEWKKKIEIHSQCKRFKCMYHQFNRSSLIPIDFH